jgi:hypothetical protein
MRGLEIRLNTRALAHMLSFYNGGHGRAVTDILQYMNNLDIVLALFTMLNHRFSRLDTTTAFQATDTTNYLYYHLFEGICFAVALPS